MNRKASHGGRAPFSSALHIAVLTDGRAGNRAQALGLAEALARRADVRIEERTVALKWPFALLPARFWHALGALPGWPALALRDGGPTLAPLASAALLIGAGRRAAPIVAHLARREGVPSVQLLDPQMDPAAFSLVAAPAHDGLGAPNAVATLGSVGRITPASIAAAQAALPAPLMRRLEALPRPRIGVLLGGSSAAARWSDEDAAAFAAACHRLAGDGYGLLITPSRRTDPALSDRLAADLPKAACFLWDGTGSNPYPGMLGMVDAVLVTADSVNMASEAAAAGLPVHVFPISHLGPKHRAFHRSLEAHGASRPFDGRVDKWTYPPLAEADRLAAIVADRLIPGRAPPPS
ncbi:MAG: mitochondrial fission ELM1 family protein [Pseudomonadota bacterium]